MIKLGHKYEKIAQPLSRSLSLLVKGSSCLPALWHKPFFRRVESILFSNGAFMRQSPSKGGIIFKAVTSGTRRGTKIDLQ